MDATIIGNTIKQLRESRSLTQAQLGESIGVGDKAVSKWENGKGLPDITLLQPLSKALGVSVEELIRGEVVWNRNRSANMMRSRFYVCPLCGNVIHSMGDAAISCCGITLPPLTAEPAEEGHMAKVERVEDEWFISLQHPMEKEHYISFLAVLTYDRLQMVKLYPEGNAEARFALRGRGMLYYHCNRHGLFSVRI